MILKARKIIKLVGLVAAVLRIVRGRRRYKAR
jgi:hypothetical protein